jgi:hypothetical protein
MRGRYLGICYEISSFIGPPFSSSASLLVIVLTAIIHKKQKEEKQAFALYAAFKHGNDSAESRILSGELVTNNVGSGSDERVYFLLIHATSNYM